MGCASSRDGDVRVPDADAATVVETRATRAENEEEDDTEVSGTRVREMKDASTGDDGGDSGVTVAREVGTMTVDAWTEVEGNLCADEVSEAEAVSRRLAALETLAAAARKKCSRYDEVERECAMLRECLDEVKREARAFVSECEIEAEMSLEQAREAVAEARRALREQSARYEEAAEDAERATRHRLAMATLKSKSDAARAKLRANEAIEECESYRDEIERLRSELESKRDLASASAMLALPTTRASSMRDEEDVSTVSDFGRDSELLRTRWQLWATRVLRKADRTVVREAEGSLVALARLQIEVLSLRQQLRAAQLDDDVSTFLDDPLEMFEFKNI